MLPTFILARSTRSQSIFGLSDRLLAAYDRSFAVSMNALSEGESHFSLCQIMRTAVSNGSSSHRSTDNSP